MAERSVAGLRMLRSWLLGTSALLALPMALGAPALAQGIAPNARPTGGQVVAGSAAITQGQAQTTVTQSSQRAAVDWRSFDVGRQHSVQFAQPNAQAWTLNRVTGPDPSTIAGRITANGGVAIVNQSGVVFAQGSQVNVASLIASAANITNQNFMAGNMVFDGAPKPGARVENHGRITVAERGLAALVGPRVANTGLIQARLGKAALVGAETYSLDLAGDGLLSIDVTQAVRTAPGGGAAIVTNSGVIEAQGGSVLISAHAASGLVEDLVRNTGRASANAATPDGAGGQVAIRGQGAGAVRVERGAVVEARGTAARGQRGGRVTVEAAGGTAVVASGARLDASGAAGGGTVQIGGRSTRGARLEGEASARGTARGARGGKVAVQAAEAVTLAAGAVADVSGPGGGGTALIGTTGIGRAQEKAARTTIEAGATVRADATVAGQGGTIAVNSTAETRMFGLLSARGGPQGGNGGFVEISGQGSMTVDGFVLLAGGPGGAAGTLFIDPDAIVIETGGGIGIPTVGPTPGQISFSDFGTDTISIDPGQFNQPGLDGVTIVLQANNTITVSDAVNRTTAGGVTLQTTTGDITFNAAFTLTSGTLTAEAGGSIVINAALTGGSAIALSAAGDITQTLAGVLTAPSLSAISSGGSVLLATAANLVDSVGGSASGSFLLASDSGLTVTGVTAGAAVGITGPAVTVSGAVSAGTTATLTAATGTLAIEAGVTGGSAITLEAVGDITQTLAGVLTATSLSATSSSGSVLLATATNLVDSVGGSASGSFLLGSGSGLTVTGVMAGAAVGISGPAVTVTGAVSAGTTATLAAATGTLAIEAGVTGGSAITLEAVGDITQTLAGVLTATSLSATSSSGSVLLATAANLVDSVGGSASGSFLLDSDSGLTVTGVTAGAAVGITGPLITVTGAVSAGTTATLTAATGTLAIEAGVTGGSAITLEAVGDITQTLAGVLTAPSLSATSSSGSVLLATAANLVGNVGGGATGSFLLASDSGLAVTGVTAGAAVGITGPAITVTGAVSAGTTASLTAATGTLALNAAVTAGTAIALSAVGNITQTVAGVLTAPSLTAMSSGGSVLLATAANLVDSVGGSAAGSFLLGSGAGLTVAGVTAGAAVGITGPLITVTGAVSAGTTATLTAATGTMTLQAGVTAGSAITLEAVGDITQTVAGVLTATSLRAASSGGSVLLATADNAVTFLAGRADGDFRFRNHNQDLTVRAANGLSGIEAGGLVDLGVTGTGGLTINRSVIGGTGVTLATEDGTVRIAPQVADTAPWVLALTGAIDIDAGGALTNNGVIWAAASMAPGAAIATGSVVRAAAGISNAGLIALADPGQLPADGQVLGALTNFASGQVLAGTVGTGAFDVNNSGQILANDILAANLANRATIVALNDIAAGTIDNSGGILAGGAVTATGTVTNFDPGIIIAHSVASTGGTLISNGVITAATSVGGFALVNNLETGEIRATRVESGAGSVVNSGTIAATEVLAAADIVNTAAGTIQDGIGIDGAVTAALLLATPMPGPLPTALEASAFARTPDAEFRGTRITLSITPGGGATGADGTDLTLQGGQNVLNRGTIAARAGNLVLEAVQGSIAIAAGTVRAGGGAVDPDLAAGTLTLRARADADPVAPDDPNGYVLQTGGTIEAGTVTGRAARAIRLDRSANSIGTVQDLRAGTRALADDDPLRAVALILRSNRASLGIADTVAAGLETAGTGVRRSGGLIALYADEIAITPGTAALRAPGGVVLLAPNSAGVAVTLGGANPGGFALETAELRRIAAETLVIGDGRNDTITLTDDVRLRVDAETLGVRGLRLDTAAGDVIQTGGVISVERLNVQAPRGTVELRALNLVDEVASLPTIGAGAETTYTLRTDAPAFAPSLADPTLTPATTGIDAGRDARFGVDASIAVLGVTSPIVVGPGRVLSLRANDLALAARLVAPRGTIELRPTTEGRAVALGGAADTPGTLSLTSAEILLLGGSGFTDAGAADGPSQTPATLLRIGRTLAPAAGETAQTAGDITLAGDVLLRGLGADPLVPERIAGLELFAGTAGNGAITQTGGVLSVGSLAGLALGTVRIDATGNAVDRLARRSGTTAATEAGAAFLVGETGGTAADLTLVTSRDLEIQAGIQASGAVTIRGAAGVSVANAVTVEAQGGAALLTAGADLTLGNASRVMASTAATLDAGGALSTGSNARIEAQGDAVSLAAGTELTLGAGTTVLGATTATLEAGGALSTGSNARIEAQGDALSLAAGTELTLGAGTTALGATTATLAAGGALSTGSNARIEAQGDAVSLTAGTGLTLGTGSTAQAATTATLAAGAMLSVGDSARVLAGSAAALTGGTGIATGTSALIRAGTSASLVAAAGSLALGTGTQVQAQGGAALLTASAGLIDLGGSVQVLATADAMLSAATGLSVGDAALVRAGTGGAVAQSTLATTTGTILLGEGVRVLATGDASLTAGGGITTGDAVLLRADGALSLLANGGTLSLGAEGTARAGSDATLRATSGSLAVGPSTLVSAGRDLTLSSGTESTVGASARLGAGRDLVLAAGTSAELGTATQVTAGRDLRVASTTGATTFGARAEATANRDLVLAAGQALSVQANADLSARQDLQATSGGDLSVAGGAVLAAARDLLGDADGAMGIASGSTLSATRNLSLSADRALTTGGRILAGTGGRGDLTLAAGDALTQTNGLLSARGGSAANTVSLASTRGSIAQQGGQPAIDAPVLTAAAPLGTINLAALNPARSGAARGNRVDRVGNMTAGQDLLLRTLEAPTTVTGTLGAGARLVLRTEQSLTLQGATLDAPGLQVAAGSLATAMDFTPPAPGQAAGLTIEGGQVRAGAAAFYASGGMTLSGAAFRIDLGRRLAQDVPTTPSGPSGRSGLLFSARGAEGIRMGTIPSTVTTGIPSAGIPPVLFDTRATLAAADPLALVRPDQPGVSPDLQPSQVREPSPGGNNPGIFGPSNGDPAGPVVLNLQAGSSPAFLLLDGGQAQGGIVAGRLGVHGQGGGADLTGTLNGSDGFQAASFGDTTRPIPPSSLQNYRINGCVLSAINCVVTPPFQPLPPYLFIDIEINLRSAGINPAEVTIPNVGEYDYE